MYYVHDAQITLKCLIQERQRQTEIYNTYNSHQGTTKRTLRANANSVTIGDAYTMGITATLLRTHGLSGQIQPPSPILQQNANSFIAIK